MPRFNSFWVRLKNRIQRVNLFVDVEKTTTNDIKNQKISTFIFLITLILSVLALLLYSSLTFVTKVGVVHQPSFSTYKKLESHYLNTLSCPCTSISNEYNKFVILPKPTFNQICSSDFVSNEWLNYVNYRPFKEAKYHHIFDFRHSAYSFFQMLRTLCTLSSQTITDHADLFLNTNLLTANVITEDTFLANMQAAHDQFISTTTSSFQTALNSFDLVIQGNGIINRLETNYRIFTVFFNELWYAATNGPAYPQNNCTCWTSSSCNTPTGFYSNDPSHATNIPDYTEFLSGILSKNSHLEYEVAGINVGCTSLSAILQSDLACLYNQSCLLQLNNYLNDSLYPFNASALTLSSASLPTVAELINHLMVDRWELIPSYEKYFNQCNPSICTYIYAHQFDIIFIMTTTTGFLGGIVTVLLLLTLPIVTFTRKGINNCLHPSISDDSQPVTQTDQPRLFTRVKNFIRSVNLFKDIDEQTEWHLFNQHLSTRIFIITLTLTLSFLIIYTAWHERTKTVTIYHPTTEDYLTLQSKYPQTLTCPCTAISNEYKQFISFQPIFHQICHSDFILKKWTDYLFYNSFLYPYDIRNIGQAFFPTLASFCNLSLETINSELFVFNSTRYVTKTVPQPELFQSQTQQAINLFKQLTTNSFLQLLSMLRETMAANALYSALLTNYASTHLDDNSTEDELNQVFYPKFFTSVDNVTCTCKTNPTACNQMSGIYNGPSWIPDLKLLFVVPGFHTACSIIDTIFLSTLECYFDQSCIDRIYNLTAATSLAPFKAIAMLYNSSNSQYETTTKIQFIVERLMIEEWNDKTSFDRYYSACQPTICTYTYNKRVDGVYIFTTFIALIGGLQTVLRMIVPSVIAFIRRKKRQIVYEGTSLTIRQRIKKFIITYNLFKNRNRRSTHELRHQRLSTRIFIFILCLTLIVQICYITVDDVPQTLTYRNLSIDQFNSLHENYPNTLQCPCQSLSIEYQNFISLQPHIHSICSSDFTNFSSPWLAIDYPRTMFTAKGRPLFRTKTDDFRQIASPFFQILTSFCRLSNQKFNTELVKFNSTTFITPNLITSDQFQIEINQIISQFIDQTARSFWRSLLFINNMTHANMLISALSSDSMLTLYPDYYYGAYEYIYDRNDEIYNSTLTGVQCDCQETPRCVQQASVYELDTITKLQSVSGIFVGCYVVEAVLQSDLRCFYDSDCLQQLINNIQLQNINVSSVILNNSTIETSRFHPETQLLDIVSNLMVETWYNQTSYEKYFEKCQPLMCTANYLGRGNMVYTVTTIIGLIGGLTDVYKFAVPLAVSLIFQYLFPFIHRKYTIRRSNTVSVQTI